MLCAVEPTFCLVGVSRVVNHPLPSHLHQRYYGGSLRLWESESQGEVASHLPSPGPLPLDEQLCGVKKMTGTRLKQYYTYSQSLINAAPSLTAGVPGRMQ